MEVLQACAMLLLAGNPSAAFNSFDFLKRFAFQVPPTSSCGHRFPAMIMREDVRQGGPARRDLIGYMLSALCTTSVQSVQAADQQGNPLNPKCSTESGAKTVVTCLDYGLQDGRLKGCAPFEACIATSANDTPSKYGVPWSPPKFSTEAKDATRAWRALVSAVEDQPGLTIAERDDDKFYLRAEGKADIPPDGTDDVEFRLLNEDPLYALFRSATRQTVYVNPVQRPVANQKSHALRLEAIRNRLGWQEQNNGRGMDGALEREIEGDPVRRIFGVRLDTVRMPDFDDD